MLDEVLTVWQLRMVLRKRLLAILMGATIALGVLAAEGRAEAQYKSYTFGFEAGYLGVTNELALKNHTPAFGVFGAFKQTDHFWLSAKALLAFPGEASGTPNTVVFLHVVPIMARYYLQTDSFRPYVGLTNSFQFTFNGSAVVPGGMWGPGATIGTEIKLKRDLFLGFEGNAFYMVVFDGANAGVFTVTSQLIFFL